MSGVSIVLYKYTKKKRVIITICNWKGTKKEMYLVQRRKNEKSNWHVVKFGQKGKAQAKTTNDAISVMNRCIKEFPGYEHRIIDTKTNEVIEQSSEVIKQKIAIVNN